MLIDSPRLTPADRAAWDRQYQYDRAIAARSTRRLTRIQDEARQAIENFATTPGGAYIGVSWGRDSVVTAHLAHGLGLPLIHVTHGDRTDRASNPDCETVKDAYLRQFSAEYREIPIAIPRAYQWLDAHAAEIGVPAGRITGLRADESGARALSLAVHGVSTAKTCRPIMRWTSQDVWLYLALHDLPTHPAYAMSFGGILPRDRLRVSSLGGDRGTDHGRAEWERQYYGPEVSALSGLAGCYGR